MKKYIVSLIIGLSLVATPVMAQSFVSKLDNLIDLLIERRIENMLEIEEPILGRATVDYSRSILPETTSLYDLGTSTLKWNRIFGNYVSSTAISATTVCVGSDCKTAWPAGGSSDFEWTPITHYGQNVNSTSTALWVQNNFYVSSTAHLSYVSSTMLTISGSTTSTFNAGLSASALNVTSATVTSTFANGIDLADGCFAVDGVCLSVGASGATTALDNLASVAINESLISDTANTDDLGSYTLPWKNIYSSSTAFLSYVSSTQFEGALVGNSDTATALFANGTNCNAGEYPLGVDASGNSESCTDASTEIISLVASAFAWTPETNYGLNVNSTSTALWLKNSLMVSSTSYLDYVSSTAMDAGTILSGTWNGTAIDFSNYTNATNGTGITFSDDDIHIDFTGSYIWTGFNQFSNVSSTLLSANAVWFGGTATTTIGLDGSLTLNPTAVLTIPYSTNPTISNVAQMAIETTSSSIRWHDGTAERALFSTVEKSFTISSSTLSNYNGATVSSTIPLGVASLHGETWISATCFTDAGTAELEFGGANLFMDYQLITTATTTQTFSANNTFGAYEKRYIRVGKTSSFNSLSCSVLLRITAD